MKISLKKIKALDPCQEGLDWYVKYGTTDLKSTLLKVNKNRPDWAIWLYTRLMTLVQRRELAIFAAEQVLPIFEKKYPNDNGPRLAIKAAQAVLKKNTPKNRAAASAAYAAIAAANAAAYAAYVAANAAYAAYAAASAANAAANAASNAAKAAKDKRKMENILIKKALKILNKNKTN